MLKDYGHHWHDAKQNERTAWSAKVRDVNEFLDQLGLVKPEGEIRAVATYHDACHLLHAQKVHDAPRHLLAQIPGLEVRDLPESELCCGAAGTYNLTQPEMSARLSRRKMENIKLTALALRLRPMRVARCKSPAKRESRASNLPSFIRWKCWTGAIAKRSRGS